LTNFLLCGIIITERGRQKSPKERGTNKCTSMRLNTRTAENGHSFGVEVGRVLAERLTLTPACGNVYSANALKINNKGEQDNEEVYYY
jgi:hypothetical protein